MRTTSASKWLPALVIGLASVTFVAFSLSARNWEPRSFALIGRRFAQVDPAGNKGYDGQFAYYIATDPIGAADNMDAAAYRYLRIVYPALAWVLSLGGRSDLAAWALIAINVVALAALAATVGELMARRAASRWYGLVVPLTAGMLFSLRADLNEPLALALALGAVMLIGEANRHVGVGAVTLLALSALTKETGYVYAGGVALWLLLARQWRSAIGASLGAIGPSMVWGALVSVWLGHSPFDTERTRFELLPFGGLRFTEPSEAQLILALWIVIPSIGLVLSLARHVRRGDRSLASILLGANLLFVMFMPRASYIDAMAVMRLSAGMMAAALFWLAESNRRWLPYLAALWIPSGLLLLVLPGVLGG